MTPAINLPATLDDLMMVDGKAELIAGRIVPIMPSGFLPGKVASRITRSLEDYIAAHGLGESVADNVGYGFDSPSRQVVSPSHRMRLCTSARYRQT